MPLNESFTIMSPDERKGYNRAMTPEEEKKLFKVAGVLVASSLIFMGGLALLVHNDLVPLHPKNTNAEMLKGYAARVEYSLRYQTLLVFWLVFNILATIGGRFKFKALNPLEERTEQRVQLMKNVLTNSFESIVVSVFSQLAFVSFAEPETVLKFIPYINIVQFVGRVAFLAGYPMKRAFGFQCTIIPNLVLTLYNVYKFFSFVGLY